MTMRTSERGALALALHEGIVPGPYLDSKRVWTYGIGHTAAAGGVDPEKMDRGMPADLDRAVREAVALFRHDLRNYEAAVARAIKVPVKQHEFDAAVSFHYNTGAIGRADWVDSLNAGNRAKAAEQIMNWTKPAAIIGRRKQEQSLFKVGAYPSGSVTVWGVTNTGKVSWRPVKTVPAGDFMKMLGRVIAEPTAPVTTPTPGNILQRILNAFLKALKGTPKL